MSEVKKRLLTERKVFFANSALIYVILYFVSYHVPMHSDDYGYYLMGFSWKDHMTHYLSWNGRFIVDWISSLLLRSFSRPVYMAINTFVFLMVVILISVLPNIINKKPLISRGTSFIVWTVLMLYWIANPNLGQTSFWLVGSVNYLWTLMWAGLYISYILYLLVNQIVLKRKQAVLLCLLGVFAGLSNEALGITIILFTLSLFVLFWSNNKPVLFTGLISTIAGYAFLYFSPGVRIRKQNDAFLSWRESPIIEKFLTHLFNRMPNAFNRFYYLYMVTIVMLIAALWGQKGKKAEDRSLYFILLFFILSFLSVLAFIVSPAMPPRSENTSLFFALLTLSMAANILLYTGVRERFIILGFVFIYCLIYFIPSYLFVSHAYKQTKIQADIREDIIQSEKDKGEKVATVYDYYFTRMLKNSDKFDTHRSSNTSKYYGLDAIRWRSSSFNYAVIRTSKPISVNMNLNNGLTLKNIYLNLQLPFEQTLIMEFDKELSECVQEGDNRLFVHLFDDSKKGYINASISLNNFIQIGDRYYYGKSIPSPELKKLHKIDFGFYNSEEKANSVEYTLDLSKYYNK